MKKLITLLLLLPLFTQAITPVLCCGFECNRFDGTGVNSTHLQALITGTSTSTVRSGLRSLRVNSINNGTSEQEHSHNLTGSTTWAVRCYIRFATLPNADCGIVGVGGGGTTEPGAYFKVSDSKIYSADNAGFGTTGVSVTTGVWYRIDIRLNGAAVDVQVDGTACSQYTGTSASFFICYFGPAATTTVADIFYDDFIASKTTSDYPIGAGNVYQFIPTSDGTHNVAGANDFERTGTGTDILNATTDSYLLIGKEPLPSAATTYINLIAPPNATDYVENIYGPGTGISTPTSAPRAVEVLVLFGKGTGTGTNNLRLALNDNGTLNDIFNGDVAGTSPAITSVRKLYTTAPTGGAWTVSAGAGNFNNVRIRCFTSDAAPDPWFIATMIEAEFAPASARPRRVNIITKP